MRNHKMYSMLVVVFLSFGLASCKKEKISGSGPVVTQERTLRDFYSIQLTGNSKLFVQAGTEFKFTVKGYENILNKLNTTISNGMLTIKYDKDVDIANDNTEIYVTMPSLVSLRSQGNSDVHISGNFIGMDVLTIQKDGNGTITAENTSATNLKLTLNGNSNFAGFGLASENAIVKLNGNGAVELTVSKNLNATITGNGKIYYKGGAQVVSNISGNGEVIKK